MTELEFTHYWSKDEIQQMKPKVEEVLEDLPQLPVNQIQIGRTKSVHGRFHRERSHDKELYIQLNPAKASLFTIAHELNHHLYRERRMDLETIALGVKYLDKKPSYLCRNDVGTTYLQFDYLYEECPRVIVDIARKSLQQEGVDPVEYFERTIREEARMRWELEENEMKKAMKAKADRILGEED